MGLDVVFSLSGASLRSIRRSRARVLRRLSSPALRRAPECVVSARTEHLRHQPPAWTMYIARTRDPHGHVTTNLQRRRRIARDGAGSRDGRCATRCRRASDDRVANRSSEESRVAHRSSRAMYIVHAGELVPQMLGPTDTTHSGARRKSCEEGDEGRARATYEMLLKLAPDKEKTDIKAHLTRSRHGRRRPRHRPVQTAGSSRRRRSRVICSTERRRP